MGVHGSQLVSELNGLSCLPLTREGRLPQSILRSRTFGEDTNQAHVVEAALATFAAKAAYELRRSQQLTRRVGFFIDTNKHKPGFRRWSRETVLPTPTADSGQLIRLVTDLFAEVYNSAQSYHRAGVYLHDFVPAGQLQTDLFGEVDLSAHDQSSKLMAAVDQLNHRFGRRRVRYAAENLGKTWESKRRLTSPRYMSNWAELPRVRVVS
jgi:DNA polymerase V